MAPWFLVVVLVLLLLATAPFVQALESRGSEAAGSASKLRLAYRVELVPRGGSEPLIVVTRVPNGGSLAFRGALVFVEIDRVSSLLNFSVSMVDGFFVETRYTLWGVSVSPVEGGGAPVSYTYSSTYLVDLDSMELYTLEGFWAGPFPYIARVDPDNVTLEALYVNVGNRVLACKLPESMDTVLRRVSSLLHANVTYRVVEPGELVEIPLGGREGSSIGGSLTILSNGSYLLVDYCLDLSLFLAYIDPRMPVGPAGPGLSVGELVNGSLFLGRPAPDMLDPGVRALGDGVYLVLGGGEALLAAKAELLPPNLVSGLLNAVEANASFPGYILFKSWNVPIIGRGWVAYHVEGFLVGSEASAPEPILKLYLLGYLAPTFDLADQVNMLNLELVNTSGFKVTLYMVEGLSGRGELELEGPGYRPGFMAFAVSFIAVIASMAFARLAASRRV